MSLTVEQLILENKKLITVVENESVQCALSLMIEYDFSQLPVTDSGQKVKGMVTSDSILQAVNHLKTIPEKINVSHATTKVKLYRKEDDLFDLLKGLQDISAAPIVDKDGRLTNIVTSYDTAEYFRKRAEDIMLAEDIEVTLRDLIESSHKNEDGTVDETSLAESIKLITPSNQTNQFKDALLGYIARTSGEKAKPDDDKLDKILKKYLGPPTIPRAFDDLNLSDFIQLFRNLWERHSADFKNLEWDSMHYLLDDVRKTRNAIAHFREVTPEQREKLRFCAGFLDRHRPDTVIESSLKLPSTTVIDTVVTSDNVQTIYQLEEELEANDSRYAPLAIWLQAQEEDSVTRTFKEIEDIIQDELPPSARQHRNWWANDTVSHVQSAQWLEVGWRVSSVNMSTERVVFSIMGDRRKAYLDFFNQLQIKLQAIEELTVMLQGNPHGKSWLTFAISPKDDETAKPTYVGFSFARRSRLRIEIYISEKEQGQTKQIFDQLHAQKEQIEAEFGAALSWEKLEHRHSSRIAYYRPDSSITDDAEKLKEIQQWAVETLPKFYSALSDRFIAAQKAVASEEEGH